MQDYLLGISRLGTLYLPFFFRLPFWLRFANLSIPEGAVPLRVSSEPKRTARHHTHLHRMCHIASALYASCVVYTEDEGRASRTPFQAACEDRTGPHRGSGTGKRGRLFLSRFFCCLPSFLPA